MEKIFAKGNRRRASFECLVLDTRRKTELAELRVYDKTRCGNVVTMTPAFNVAEADETVAIHRHYGFLSSDLVDDVVGRTPGDTGAALKRGLIDEVAYEIGIFYMLFSCEHH